MKRVTSPRGNGGHSRGAGSRRNAGGAVQGRCRDASPWAGAQSLYFGFRQTEEFGFLAVWRVPPGPRASAQCC